MCWRNSIPLLLAAALLAGCAVESPETAEPTEETYELVEYLFVQHAESVTLEDGLLTLEGVGDDILYFSDRPHRIVGRESLEKFLDAWHIGDDSFAKTPPNAVLAVKHEGRLADIAVVLTNPVLTDRTLVYEVMVLDGPESGSGDLAALFIDAFLKKALKREVGRAGKMRDRVKGGVRGFREGGRGGDRDLPRDPGGGGRDRDLPRDPGGGGGIDRDLPRDPGMGERRGRGGSRDIHRGGGSRKGPEIR